MEIGTILSQIDLGSIALPEFQRGYVWNRDQVRGLMDSLYRKHPVGSLLVWVTKAEDATARGDINLPLGTVQLLLDGQQRLTSLYGIIRGKPPKFFEGNPAAFTDLYFNLEEETFAFYAPIKMKGSPLWINVTELMQRGVGAFVMPLATNPELKDYLDRYITRLNSVDAIKNIDLHIEQVTGHDKTIDVVVDIFNKVNSGGTKLSKGDLALAKVCAEWPQARDEMQERLNEWNKAGFSFRLEWLLRCINAIVTGEALFTALADVSTAEFAQGLTQAEKSVDTLLNLISSRLGLDHDRVLGSRYSFPLLARYLTERGGHLAGYQERDKLLYWYIHTFLWGRYAGSTETVLNQDLALIEETEGGLDRLIEQLRQNRGDLRVHATDFRGFSRGARFYPLLYMLTRVCHAKDWCSGLELSNSLLGKLSSLQVHHIFPRALLYNAGYSQSEVNALANFSFLTQECNLEISDRPPHEYLEEVAECHPGALESHWMPMDRALWRTDRYLDFLEARRELLAAAANSFLDSLLAGTAAATEVAAPVRDRPQGEPLGSIASDEEEQVILECAEWVHGHGLPEGELMYELVDEETGQLIAVFDLAWPKGLQEELSPPVALILNEPVEIAAAANQAGFLYFRSVEKFREYVLHDVLALEPAAN